MSNEYFIRQLCRQKWRYEGDLTASPVLSKSEYNWWLDECHKIEQEEAQSV